MENENHNNNGSKTVYENFNNTGRMNEKERASVFRKHVCPSYRQTCAVKNNYHDNKQNDKMSFLSNVKSTHSSSMNTIYFDESLGKKK